jgi:uncharacterized membrane protein YjdF
MPTRSTQIDTAMARVVRTADNMVEVHIRHMIRMDEAGMREVMEARRSLMAGDRGTILFVAEGDPDWDPTLLKTDHFGAQAESITAVAFVVSNKVLALVLNTHFSLFPPSFSTLVGSEPSATREWLLEK